ncbi:YegP family protein [Leisingera sp. NJS204]|uniref:YegP family protein n=1 Tax=Leisingera sp. NJS204 TaxID=2508307 RepID=UPI0020C766FC|nr:YegP family protein [Leisingera sp. NJS204]
MPGKFELYEDNAGEFRFRLKARSGENILASEGYKQKASAENGIESVRKNAGDDACYERKETSAGKHMFNLKASNGQVIGTSQSYANASGRDNGIESVKRNAQDAGVDDLSSDLSRNRIAQVRSLAQALPDQSDIVKFGLTEKGKVQLVAVPNTADDVERIITIREELISADGPIAALSTRYSRNPNAPQAALLERVIGSYAKELSKDIHDINFAVLFVRGTRLVSASNTAQHNIQTGEWPDFEPEEQEALDSLIALHGPLMMATPVGRDLVAASNEFDGTPEKSKEEEGLFQELAETVADETEVFEAETLDAIHDITTPVEFDLHPARTRRLRVLLAGSLLTSVAGASAWLASLGSSLALIPAVGGMFIWEVVKKTDDFKSVTDLLAKGYDGMPDQAAEQLKNLKRMSKLLEKRRAMFTKLADLRPEFGWAKRYIKPEETVDDGEE